MDKRINGSHIGHIKERTNDWMEVSDWASAGVSECWSEAHELMKGEMNEWIN